VQAVSLDSFIRKQADVQHGFGTRLVQPRIRFDRTLRARPLTTNYQLVEGAFGYLLRFRLQRINPKASVSAWAAEAGVKRIGVAHEDVTGMDVLTPSRHPRELRAAAYIADAKRRYQAYIEDGHVTDELLVSVYRLAHLELAIHGGADRIDWRSINYLRATDAEDLRALLDLVDEKTLRARTCILDPRLPASEIVGGADPDFILDDCIVDVTTSHKPSFDLRDFYRLVGYFLLVGLGGVTDGAGNQKRSSVSSIGVYFARFGQFWKVPVKEILPPSAVPEMTRWFVDSARRTNEINARLPAAFKGPLAVHLAARESGLKKIDRR
jgi:hypothetical protein